MFSPSFIVYFIGSEPLVRWARYDTVSSRLVRLDDLIWTLFWLSLGGFRQWTSLWGSSLVWYLNWLLNTSKADGFTKKIDDIIPKYSPSINRFQLLTIQLFFIQHLVFWSLLQPNLVVTLILNSLFLHGIASICNNLRHPSQGWLSIELCCCLFLFPYLIYRPTTPSSRVA